MRTPGAAYISSGHGRDREVALLESASPVFDASEALRSEIGAGILKDADHLTSFRWRTEEELDQSDVLFEATIRYHVGMWALSSCREALGWSRLQILRRLDEACSKARHMPDLDLSRRVVYLHGERRDRLTRFLNELVQVVLHMDPTKETADVLRLPR